MLTEVASEVEDCDQRDWLNEQDVLESAPHTIASIPIAQIRLLMDAYGPATLQPKRKDMVEDIKEQSIRRKYR